MNERAPDIRLRDPLRRHHGRHHRSLLFRHALRAASVCAVALTLAVLLGAAFLTGAEGAWLRLAALAAVSSLAIGLAVRRFLGERLGLDAYLERAEDRFPEIRSLVRNAVDFESSPAENVSPELARAVRDQASAGLERTPLRALDPPVRPARPALAMLGGLVVMVLAATLWPAQTSRSWATLWNPSSAAPPVRIEVEPGAVTVSPGASLAVRARIWGSDRAPKLARDRGESPEAVAEGRDERGGRLWRFDLAQLTRSGEYWVRLGHASTPRYRISLAGSLQPVSFEIEYRSPGYARMPVQRGTAARGDLSALRGTRASLVVTFDRDLEGLAARQAGGPEESWTSLSPRRWKGVIEVDRDGEYELIASARPDDGLSGERQGRFRYRISALSDAPPLLSVQVPETDVDLPAGQLIPLDVVAQDDLGLSELVLQYRKDGDAPWSVVPMARFPARPRDARVVSQWNASALGLLPGQSASFRFVLFDDRSFGGRNRTESRVFELRFPSLADLYDRVDERQEGSQRTLERVAQQAKELQKTLDRVARQQPRQSQSPGSSFERDEELRSALERQQDMGRQIDEAVESLQQSLEEAAERQAFDEELLRKMRQLGELMEQIQSPEFKEAMRRMQQALEKMDRRDLERQMPEWRAQNQEMLRNLERTLELLKRLREEERLQSLAQRARDLESRQNELNQEHEQASREPGDRAKAEQRAQRQQSAAQESQELNQETREAAKDSEDPGASEELEKAAQEAQEASEAQDQASQSARQRQNSQARQSGQKASESLRDAAQRLQRAAESMQREQAEVDLAAVRRAAQDLVSLQRANQTNLSSNLPPSMMADRQTDLSEGTARVADSLYQLSRQTPFISQQLAEALGRAIRQLGDAGRELSSGNQPRGEENSRMAGRSLTEAVLELRKSESAMCQNPTSGNAGPSNPQRIGEIGRQQSELNRQSRRLSEQLSQQMRLQSQDRGQLTRLAQEQERIRRQLEEIRRDEETRRELLGRLDQTEREMKEVEEVLRQGTIDGTLEQKQQRILSRLLDAERSVHRRDFDPERESRPGKDVARGSPAELPAELLRPQDRFRQNLLKSELDRYPAHYRAFVETYLRLLNGSRR